MLLGAPNSYVACRNFDPERKLGRRPDILAQTQNQLNHVYKKPRRVRSRLFISKKTFNTLGKYEKVVFPKSLKLKNGYFRFTEF